MSSFFIEINLHRENELIVIQLFHVNYHQQAYFVLFLKIKHKLFGGLLYFKRYKVSKSTTKYEYVTV